MQSLRKGSIMRNLDKQLFYSKLHSALIKKYGDSGKEIWKDAADEYDKIISDKYYRTHKGAMAIPAVALYHSLSAHGMDADRILQRYGDVMGNKLAKAVRKLTYIPFLEDVLWKNINSILHSTSSPKKGYKRRITSQPPVMYGVDILSCPFHEICKKLGEESAVLCICHMDKNYSKGFRKLKYERYSALPEGADCCEYKIRQR